MAFEQFTLESSHVPQTLPASIPSMPTSWPCPGYRHPSVPSASLTSLAWSSLSCPFHMLKFFCFSSLLMHDTSLNFPDSSNHQQQSHHNMARNQRTCPWPRCPNRYSISKPEENSTTEDDLVKVPLLPTRVFLSYSEQSSSWCRDESCTSKQVTCWSRAGTQGYACPPGLAAHRLHEGSARLHVVSCPSGLNSWSKE